MTRPTGGRPALEAAARRSQVITVRLTPAEAAAIAGAAARTRRRPVAFVRDIALAAVRGLAPGDARAELERRDQVVGARRDLVRVGSLLNQIACRAHQGKPPPDAELRRLVEDTRELVARLAAELSR